MSEDSIPYDHDVVVMRLGDPRAAAASNGWPVLDRSNRFVSVIGRPSLDGKRKMVSYVSDAYLFLLRLDKHLLLPGGLVTDRGQTLYAHGLTYDLRPGRTDLGLLDYKGDLEPVQVAVPRRRRRIEGPAIALIGSHNFGHMLFEFLPRLYTMSFARELQDMPVIVTAKMPKRFIEFLEIGGISRDRLIFQEEGEALEVEQLWVPSVPFGRTSNTRSLYFSMPALSYLRDRFYMPFRHDSREKRTRVYLNRTGATFRRLVNEEELLPILKNHGFITMEGIDQSAREQLSLIANAEIVFSQIGSSPTITMFAPADAFIVETCPQNVGGAFVGTAFATMLTQLYHRIWGERVVLPDNTRPESLYHDYRVDPGEVSAALDQMKTPTDFLIF